MESIDTLISAFVLGAVGLLLGLQTRGLCGEMKAEFQAVRGEIAEVRREMHEEFRSVRGELAILRSDLTRIGWRDE